MLHISELAIDKTWITHGPDIYRKPAPYNLSLCYSRIWLLITYPSPLIMPRLVFPCVVQCNWRKYHTWYQGKSSKPCLLVCWFILIIYVFVTILKNNYELHNGVNWARSSDSTSYYIGWGNLPNTYPVITNVSRKALQCTLDISIVYMSVFTAPIRFIITYKKVRYLHLIRFLIRSDELLNPYYGRSAIGAELASSNPYYIPGT